MGCASFKCLKYLNYYTRYLKNVQRGEFKNSGPSEKIAVKLKLFLLFVRLIYKNVLFSGLSQNQPLCGAGIFPEHVI